MSSAKSAVSRAASTVKSIAKSISPKATISRVVQSGSRIAANLKAGVSKITAKVQQGIQKANKTVKSLVSPKTIRQKTRAAVSGVKATMSSIKKMVSGKISKAEKFAGAQKLALLSAARTAKGAMVKYAMPGATRIASTVKSVVSKGGKYFKGQVLGLFDSKNTSKITNGLKELGQGFMAGVDATVKIIAAPGNALRNASDDINKGNYSSIGRDFVKGLTGQKQTSVMDLFLTKEKQTNLQKRSPNLYQFTSLALSNVDPAIFIGGSGIKSTTPMLGVKASSTGGTFALTKRLLAEETGTFDPFFGLGRKGTGEIAGKKAIVIGEGMGDVKTVTKQLQAEGVDARWYQVWSKNFPAGRRMTQEELDAALARNQRWIKSKIKQGYDIYDVGIDPNRLDSLGRSPFYELEQQILHKNNYPTIDVRGMRP